MKTGAVERMVQRAVEVVVQPILLEIGTRLARVTEDPHAERVRRRARTIRRRGRGRP
jgi:hypothetical protein